VQPVHERPGEQPAWLVADEAGESSAARAQHCRTLQPGVGVDQFQPDGPPVVVVVESQLDVGHTQASKVEVAMRPAFAVENSDVEQLRWLADDLVHREWGEREAGAEPGEDAQVGAEGQVGAAAVLGHGVGGQQFGWGEQ